jgi:hypothetical protein
MNTFPCPRYDLQQSEIFYADNKNCKQQHLVFGYIYTDEWPHGLVPIHDPEDVLNATQVPTAVPVAFEKEPPMGTGVKTLARVNKKEHSLDSFTASSSQLADVDFAKGRRMYTICDGLFFLVLRRIGNTN